MAEAAPLRRAEPDPAGPAPAAWPQVSPGPRPPVRASGTVGRARPVRPSRTRPWPRWRPPSPGTAGRGDLGAAGGAASTRTPPAGATVPSAVLVALFEEGGEARVVLTRRSVALRDPPGPGELPRRPGRTRRGGRPTPPCGRRPRRWGSTGRRSGWWAGSAGAHLLVELAHHAGGRPCWTARPDLVASPAEVARVFDVALADLAADGVFHEERWSVPEPSGDRVGATDPSRSGSSRWPARRSGAPPPACSSSCSAWSSACGPDRPA